MSSAHRITGCAMGGGMSFLCYCKSFCIHTEYFECIALYLGAMAYLAAPVLGYHIDTNTIISAFGAAPEAVKVSTKVILALPFTFHASNGIRHLVILWNCEEYYEDY